MALTKRRPVGTIGVGLYALNKKGSRFSSFCPVRKRAATSKSSAQRRIYWSLPAPQRPVLLQICCIMSFQTRRRYPANRQMRVWGAHFCSSSTLQSGLVCHLCSALGREKVSVGLRMSSSWWTSKSRSRWRHQYMYTSRHIYVRTIHAGRQVHILVIIHTCSYVPVPILSGVAGTRCRALLPICSAVGKCQSLIGRAAKSSSGISLGYSSHL